MGKAILITGAPGCGKTTIIQRVIDRLPDIRGGFFTREIRQGGVRKGFELITLDGRHGILAHVELKSKQRVGKYGVNLSTLNGLAIETIQQAILQGGVVVIDEIGPMEIASRGFCQAVLEALESQAIVLGTIVQRSIPFTDGIKHHKHVTLIKVRLDNRDQLPDQILAMLSGYTRL